MPNPNYKAGRRFEYDTMELYRKKGFNVVRTAGSHGAFDVIAFDTNRKPVFIQCKRVATAAEGRRMGKVFSDSTQPSLYYHQCLAIKLKGNLTTTEVII